MVILSLNVYKNTQAKPGEPTEWIDLKELWLKAHYKIPYDRWAKYTCRNHGVQPRITKVKTGGKGQPVRHYFVPLDKAKQLLGAIERKRHVEIKTIRANQN
jgi:hypothetical protein